MTAFRGSRLAIGLACIAPTACDGYLATRGRVYGLPRRIGTDSSRIYVDEPFPSVDGLIPLDSAVVWVFGRPTDQTQDTTVGRLWSQYRVTSTCGSFETGQTAAPMRFEALVQVQRNGFQGTARRFRHDSIPTHRILVILVPTLETGLPGRQGPRSDCP